MTQRDEPAIVDSTSGLFGIVSRDAQVTQSGIGVVILNSGILHRVGPYRLHVQLGRALATDGCVTLRLDQSGKGDSETRPNSLRHDIAKQDLRMSAEFLKTRYDCKHIVLIGLCSGADDILNYAHDVPDLLGAIHLDGYAHRNIHYYFSRYLPKLVRFEWVKKLFSNKAGNPSTPTTEAIGQDMDINIREWGKPVDMLELFIRLDRKNVHNYTIFTADASDYYFYQNQLQHNLRAQRYQPKFLTEELFPKAKHLFPIEEHRDDLIRKIRAWIGTLPNG